jgi:hypothetical protein
MLLFRRNHRDKVTVYGVLTWELSTRRRSPSYKLHDANDRSIQRLLVLPRFSLSNNEPEFNLKTFREQPYVHTAPSFGSVSCEGRTLSAVLSSCKRFVGPRNSLTKATFLFVNRLCNRSILKNQWSELNEKSDHIFRRRKKKIGYCSNMRSNRELSFFPRTLHHALLRQTWKWPRAW